jgi:hypothetical protein
MASHLYDPPPLAYDMQGLIKASGWGRSKIQADIAAGRLKARKSAGKLIILYEDARAWLLALPVREPSEKEAA